MNTLMACSSVPSIFHITSFSWESPEGGNWDRDTDLKEAE